MSIRVLLADDQALVRGGFRIILDARPDRVVGEAGDGAEAERHLDGFRSSWRANAARRPCKAEPCQRTGRTTHARFQPPRHDPHPPNRPSRLLA